MAIFNSTDEPRKRRWYKASTILGSIFILMPNGLFMYWGNIAVYVLSYFVFELSSESGIQAPWIISLFISFAMAGLFLYSFTSHFIGCHMAAVLGIFMSDFGIALSYFAVKNSFLALTVTLSVMVGLGSGLITGYALTLLVHWADKDIGFTIAFNQGSFYWGVIIINQFMTAYINPKNFAPDARLGNSLFFSYRDVLDKVPSSFLVLLCFSVFTHWLGFLLIKENHFDKAAGNASQKRSDCNAMQDHSPCYRSIRKDTAMNEGSHLTTANFEQASPTSTTEVELLETEQYDYSPMEVLKTMTFYALWLTYFFAEFPFLLLNNYYKLFGQLWIPDDHFLTDLGTILAFVNIWARIFWGIAIDKIGAKKCLTLQTSLVVLLSVWFYFTPVVNRWLYAVICCLFTSMTGALFNAVINLAVLIFGKKHFSTNLGLLRSSSITLNLLAPLAIESILKAFGWFYTFTAAGCLNIISLLLVLKFVPRKEENPNER